MLLRQLVVKEECLASAQSNFDGSGIQITEPSKKPIAGWPYLAAAIGASHYIRNYTQDCISQWARGLSQLSLIAAS